MSRLTIRTAATIIAAMALLAIACGSWAQDAPVAQDAPKPHEAAGPLTAKLDPSGMIQLTRGAVELAMIELNAHGAEWKHAPQATATAQASTLPNGAGRRFVGTLPVPNTDGGAIRFTETIRLLPQGFRLEYDLGVTKAMKLDGLQLSLNLPVAAYAGKSVAIGQLQGEPQGVTLPPEKQEKAEQTFQLWSGEGARVEVAKDTDASLTAELRAPTDLVIQDLRKWGTNVFEIRFPAIMEDPGRDVAADDKFHLDLTITFATPVKLEGP